MQGCGVHGEEPWELYNAWRKREEENLRRLEQMTSNPKLEQELFLERVLKENANAAYLQQFGLNGATDVETFRERVPVSDYTMLRPFVRRILGGDKGQILSASPVVELMTSSGTSGGESKVYPITHEDLTLRLDMWLLSRSLLNRNFPGLDKGKTTRFEYLKPPSETEDGLRHICGTTSFSMFEGFRTRPFDPSYRLTAPDHLYYTPDYVESMYCQLLLALYQREEVLLLSSYFASTVVRVLRDLEQWWPKLCDDLAKGSVSSTKVQSKTALAAINCYRRADPNLAELVRRECSIKSWKGIVRKLWPNCKAIDVISSGSMQQYRSILRHLSDDLPIICSQMYVASEGFFALNFTPSSPQEETLFTLIPSSAYFEFIPVASADGTHKDDVVDLAGVKEGVTYEILVTTVTGLCRYRIGDVLEMAGYYNAAPSFRIIGRSKLLQPVDMEKVGEGELYEALTKISDLFRESLRSIEDFTSTVDLTGRPGHYVVFLEVNEVGDLPSDLLESSCTAIEATFNEIYRYYRCKDQVGALELRVVRPGTFARLAARAVSLGTSPDQYKAPRSIDPQNTGYIDILNGEQVSVMFAKLCPLALTSRDVEFNHNS